MGDEPMEVEAADLSQDFAARIKDLRTGLVNCSTDVFLDINGNVERDCLERSAKAFVEYFRVCLNNSPSVFSLQIDPNTFRSESNEVYSENELKVFSKWVYRACGAFLLSARLTAFHSDIYDLMTPLFLALKHNHSHVLVEAVSALVGMLLHVMKKTDVPGGFFKVSFNYEPTRRPIQIRTPISSISPSYILNILKITLPHLDVLKKQSSLCVQLLQSVHFIMQHNAISPSEKLDVVLSFALPLNCRFQQAQTLWCSVIVATIKIGLQNEGCWKSSQTFLERICEYELLGQNADSLSFLIEFESGLFKIILDPIFKESKHESQEFIIGLYKRARSAISVNGVDTNDILRKENSIEFACYVFENLYVALPIFSEVIHKEMFRILDSRTYTDTANMWEIRSRTPIWTAIRDRWATAVSQAAQDLKEDHLDKDSKGIIVKTLFERAISCLRLMRSVLSHADSLSKLHRAPKGGSVQELIFWDGFINLLQKLIQIQAQIPALINGDSSKFIQWPMVFTNELGEFVGEKLSSLRSQLLYHITFPFFPEVFYPGPLTSDQLAQHSDLYGKDLMEECIKTLGSDYFSSHDNKASILNVIHLAMEKSNPECIRGVLRLVGGVRHICRAISHDQLLEFFMTITLKEIWVQDDEIGVLLAKALCRLGCILTKAKAPLKNGTCEVCDTGNHYYEPKHCKMKQLRECLLQLIQKGSTAVHLQLLESVMYLKNHGLVPDESLVASFLRVIRELLQFNLLVKLLRSSERFLSIYYPKHETAESFSKMFKMIFLHLRNFLKSFSLKMTFDALIDLLDALTLVSKTKNDILATEIANTGLLILTLNWSASVASKCKLLFRALAETRGLRTCEYMAQIRDNLVQGFAEMSLFQVFGAPDNTESSDRDDVLNCKKCEVLLRAVEQVMEFRREDFVRIYFPDLLSIAVPMVLKDKRARLLIRALSQFALVSIKELLEINFSYVFLSIGITSCRSTAEANGVLKFLEISGLSLGVLTSLMAQGLMNEVLSHFAREKEKVKRLLSSFLAVPSGKRLSLNGSTAPDKDLRTYISERLMGYFVYLDCKMDSRFENEETKRKIFTSFLEVISYLGPLVSGMKMRIAKLLNSCTRRTYLQGIVANGWKIYTKTLDDTALPSMINEILASLVYLKSLSSNGSEVLEEMAYYIISEKNRVTREYRYQVYYIQEHIQNQKTLSMMTNSKQSGMNLLEFLIESLKSGNVYIRHQAIMAVRRVVNFEDTSIDLRELLEDSQFVHPNVCRLILALLECLQSQDKDLANITMSVIGCLGAVDYYRMKVKSSDRQSRRDGTSIFPAAIPFAHAYIDMLRKQYQGTDLSLPSDIDICAYAVQEVLKIYHVGVHNAGGHPVWSGLPQETKSFFTSLISSKFSLKDIQPLNEYPCPLYGSKLGESLQDWCTNFVIQMYKFVTSTPAKEIFRVTLPLLVRSLPVALYLLPYVALFAALDGTAAEKRIIYKELRKICMLWYIREEQSSVHQRSVSHTPYEDDSHFDEPLTGDAGVADRLAVTNAVFSVVDLVSYVSRYGGSNFIVLNSIATIGSRGTGNSSSPVSSVLGTPLTQLGIKGCKAILPDPMCMARAAFQTQSYQRALLNLEEYLFVFPEMTQKYLSFLQRIFIALEDTDAVIGVSPVRRGKPNIYEETLELLATAKKEDAASKFQLMMQKGFNDFSSENVLMQGYFSIEKPEMALTVMNGLTTRGRTDVRSSPLDDCRIEACWKLQRWGDLATNLKGVRTDLSSRGTLMHAAILSLFQRKRYPAVLDILGQARQKCLNSLSTVDINIDSYHSRYAEITRLHIFSEVEQAVELMKLGEKRMSTRAMQRYRTNVANLLKNWNDRLNLVQKSLSIVEPIVNTRKALLHIMKENTKRLSVTRLFSGALRDCCLTVAKLEIRAKNYGRANACIQEARQFRSPEVYIQDAKFVALRGDMDRGIRIMNECMKQYFSTAKIKTWESLAVTDPLEADQELCAKALLLLAKFNDEKCNVDMDVNINNYLQVTQVHKKSEKNFFHLANYCDTISNNQSQKAKQSEMQESVVRFYCKSLEYGSKHVYQSLPRLLFVWLNFASNPPPKTEPKAVQEKHIKTVREMSDSIAQLYNNVPAYIFLTVFSQLISRICHPSAIVWNKLKEMIAGIVVAHHHQALWMMMAVSKSTYKMRQSRCAEILKAVEEKAPDLKTPINDYSILADQLIDLAINRQASEEKVTTIEKIAPSLVRLLKRPNLSPILMPFQQFLNVTISRVGSHHMKHKPFQQNAVFIKSVEKNVEIMPSHQRPKRITFRGSDGRTYGILCKPEDDLRKDSKVMEMNNIVNWYLAKDPEARERNLHVRTYAVVALNEDTGLLEWVPNLQGIRPLLLRLYKEKKLHVSHAEVKEIYPTEKGGPMPAKLAGYHKLVNRHPPLLREWFLTYFSDPQEWYTARSTFTRTCAVMSMVGYLIGLGDRHGENILLDSISGDVVHVDFNCLFNKGETFEVPEVVPFRLTHNMVNAMGPLGCEGPFRRSCEITIAILRQNSAVFMSVLRPFVFDPLVEWSKTKTRGVANQASTSSTGEVSNSMAVENIKAIQLRLEGVARNMTKELNVPLSVEAQVSYLIKEATAPTNLCQMYVGWGAYY